MASSANKQKIQNRQVLESDSDWDSEMFMNNDRWPRYLVMTSTSKESHLSKLSPFATQNAFQAIAGTLKSIKRSRDGSFLVECCRKAQATNLSPVKVTIHKVLNSSCGVIRCRDLRNMSELEIWNEMKDQVVVGVHHVIVRKNGEVIPTSTLFLMFSAPDLSEEIKVGYLRVKVEMFVSNPLRCFNCNRFGHTSA